MTRPANFSGRKNERRLSAISLLEKQIASQEHILGDISNRYLFDFSDVRASLLQKQYELEILKKRLTTGGKRLTKKVGQNLGRRNV